MYAIVEISGHQYKVKKDQRIFVNRMKGKEGSKVEFNDVLLIDNEGKVQVGTPVLKGAGVSAKILSHPKDDKVIVFKKKRRKGYKVKNGHRQYLTELQIEKIVEKGVTTTKKAETKAEKPAAEPKKETKAATAKKETPATEAKKESKAATTTTAKKTTTAKTTKKEEDATAAPKKETKVAADTTKKEVAPEATTEKKVEAPVKDEKSAPEAAPDTTKDSSTDTNS